jgi:hypothetical protein
MMLVLGNERCRTIAQSARSSRLGRLDWRTILAFALPFILYILTLAPTVYNLDSAELTTAAATAGITRATGYPLYLLAGYLWSWLPLGDIGYRMNLFSAFNGAITLALTERILRRCHVGPWASLGALGLLACAPFFWSLSLIAEVYTLHTALMAGLILVLLRWASEPTPRRLALVGLVAGLSLAHHGATALLIPGCVWYIITVAPQRALAPRSFLPAIGALLLGLSVYLYLPLRYSAMPTFNYAGQYDASSVFRPVDLRAASGLWWLISGRAFSGQMLAYHGSELWREVGRFGIQIWRAFFAIGIGPGVAGAAVLLRRDWRLGGMKLLMFVCCTVFYIDYRVVDKETMFLPSYLIWSLWLGVGYQWLLGWVRGTAQESARPWNEWLARGLIVGAVLIAAVWNWRQVDLSQDRSARARGETILHEVQPRALILGWWETAPLIEYLQLVEGQRPDVQVINRFLVSPDDLRQIIAHEVSRRPVYIDSLPGTLPQNLEVRPIGSLYRLSLPSPHRRASGRASKLAEVDAVRGNDNWFGVTYQGGNL